MKAKKCRHTSKIHQNKNMSSIWTIIEERWHFDNKRT